MERMNRILWYEGMNLEPHHFQQWDRFIEYTTDFKIKTLVAHYWGLSDFLIDKDALVNGNFKLLKCTGIMPDGLSFQMPEIESLPTMRSFTDYFPPTQEILGVYLAITTDRTGGHNYSIEDNVNKKDLRFSYGKMYINDENSGSGEREISIARANFKIMFESESLEDLNTVKIAEITRSAEGEFILNKDYFTPSVSINASDNMISLLRRILEMIISRSNALRKRRRQLSDGTLEITPNDMPIYWLLYTANTYIPVLNQYINDGSIHPMEIYHNLLSLTGQLSTFSTDEKMLPQDLPLYDHSNSAKGFIKLEQNLMKLFGDITPVKNYLHLDLEKKGETIYVAQIKESNVIKDYVFYVICTSGSPDENLINEIPVKFRIASPDMIKKVLSSATPALPIKYIARPPTGVPMNAHSLYFRLEKDDQFWKSIENSNTIVIYKPSEFREMQIELIAVKKSE